MKCMNCGYNNEPDAKFCRDCGTPMTGIQTTKDKIEFIPTHRRKKDQEISGGIVIGAIFIFVGIIMAIAIFTSFFSDFGSSIGGFFGGFGENMGQIGSDFGEFMGNWGENLGESLGSFFSGEIWWSVLKILIVAFFIITGVIIVIYNINKNR